ncbi:hypothetical protein VTK73DRAFT_1731 [Phialemonium thermophilum]|uniref:Uncharacterized protein n=1 Tax=Phialemonium thermophilum TaxID=223376 RepID=A0ABR3VT47_9PEZI
MPELARQDSALSSLSSLSSIPKPPPLQGAAQTRRDVQAEPEPRRQRCCHDHKKKRVDDPTSHYPLTAPHRSLFLAARIAAFILGVAEIVLVSVAAGRLNRAQWLSPMLTPAINALWASGPDLYAVLRLHRRSVPLSRFLYDGLIFVGYAIGSGFLLARAMGDLTGSASDATYAKTVVAGGAVACMFVSLVLELAISLTGALQWWEIRRAKRIPFEA